MAITNTVKKTSIGTGNPLYYVAAATVNATGSQTVTLTANLPASATQGSSVGCWRVKVQPLTTATTVSSITITGGNATTTENVWSGGPYATNSRGINQMVEFITDLSPGFTNLTAVVVFGAAATGVVDFEWFGNP